MIKQEYYLGLDCGTDSIGYAVTDEAYALLKSKGEPMIGVMTFDEPCSAQERRANRTGRRRLHRRQQRVQLLQELFAPAIAARDPGFFQRLRESALWRQDVTTSATGGVFFNDDDFTDREYHRMYPTIHHLICELMESEAPHDVRLVYLACAWLVAHRGHFLSAISEDNLESATDIRGVYADFMNWFETEKPWECDAEAFGSVLKARVRIRDKEAQLNELLFNGAKNPPVLAFDAEDLDAPVLSRAAMVKLLSGGKVKASDLFLHRAEEYAEVGSISLGGKEEDLAMALSRLGEDAELVLRLKALFDWAVLADILRNEPYISRAKVLVYDRHREDLARLKAFIRKYLPARYDEVFNASGGVNYAAYSRHAPTGGTAPKYVSKEDFCDYLRKLVAGVSVEEEDLPAYEDMMARLEACAFLPKQRDRDNRVIPYQLYAYELRMILARAERYLPFLAQRDADGLSVSDKIISIFKFRIPYYVGPLNQNSSYAWLERKAERIYPWNFEKIVDLDASEDAFIRRMTGRCNYLPSEYVLTKNALCYARFNVLNEINLLKINSVPITVAQKQAIYTQLFERRSRVTFKALQSFCIAEGYMNPGDTISGIDKEGIKSSLRPQQAFARLLRRGDLTEAQAEQIVERITCTEERPRLHRWLCRTFPQLAAEDIDYLSRLKFSDFGRLSRRFLCELEGMCRETGEVFTVLEAMWETNCTLMELLSDRFTFAEHVREEAQAYYAEHPRTLEARMDDLYLSNGARRPIYRTLEIVKDVVHAAGGPPKKIFVEMARGGTADQKGKRTKSRKEQIREHYKRFAREEVRDLLSLLDARDENELQSEKLYLYFMQLGRCMYSGEPIDLQHLSDRKFYDVDHIFPQCRVKDDSVLNNKVLCLSVLNGQKGDVYPIAPEIRQRMGGFWAALHDKGLLTDEKYRRLTRTTPFTDEELMGFIQRQLVETRQSTKAIAAILKERYPEAQIVYVKAGLVSEFRQEFGMLKSRILNDLHHAKDAYLNIVVGNVYYERFNKNYFRLNETYSMKTRELFTHSVWSGGARVWRGGADIGLVREVVSRNHIHVTRFAFYRRGALFDQQPLRAQPDGGDLIPRKANLPVERYGGYRKPTATFFMLARYTAGRKRELMVVPIDLMAEADFRRDDACAPAVVRAAIEKIVGKPVDAVELPLGMRVLKVNTVFSLDGFRVALSGKVGGGKQLLLTPLMPLWLDARWERYVKRIESFQNKRIKRPGLSLQPAFDRLTLEENLLLYDLLRGKLAAWPYSKRPGTEAMRRTLEERREAFSALPPEAQVALLAALLGAFGRSGQGTDLTPIGGVKSAGVPLLSSSLSNWKKLYADVRIVDPSPAGLFERASVNLLSLL